jgi:NarL family two-component system response regulator LiaR
MNGTIRVIIVDDHAIVRKGIIALLATEKDIHVVGEASDGSEAIALVDQLKPDMIIMDLVMPGVSGIDAIQQITAQDQTAKILVLTSFATDDKVFPALKAGALGYLLKDSNPQELLDAIRQVYKGESWLHPSVAKKVLKELTHTSVPSNLEELTERETEVLKLVAHGMSNREIAEKLVISEATVRTHVSSLLAKLHLASRTQAALFALREGLASLGQDKE